MIDLTFIYILLTFLSTLFGGLLALKYVDKTGILSSFAAGVLIGVPFFDLIPETIKIAEETKLDINNIFTMIVIGFSFLLFLERYLSVHRICDENGCRNERHLIGGYFGALELSGHSFMDGFAIGAGFHIDFHIGLLITIAVIAHDFSDGLNTVTIMLKSGNSTKNTFRMLLLDATTPILGFIIATFIFISNDHFLLILAFFGGGFIYLGASDLLPEAHELNPPIVTLITFIFGISFIYLVVNFL